jgi:hypothetical protein
VNLNVFSVAAQLAENLRPAVDQRLAKMGLVFADIDHFKESSAIFYQITFRANCTSRGCVARLSICPAPANDPSWLNSAAPA